MIIHSQIFDVKSRRALADYTCTYQTCSKINYDDLPNNCEDLFAKQGPLLLQHDDMLTNARVIDHQQNNLDSNLITFMGQGILQAKTGSTFYLLCIQLKTNAEDDGSGLVGDQQAEMSRFNKFSNYVHQEVNDDAFDSGGSLTQSLSIKMRDAMAIVNPPYKKKLTQEEITQINADEESNKKIGHIEIELEEIAQGVRENLDSLFKRGEKFDSLSQKSEQLKSVSGSLKKRATQIRKQSEGWNILQLLASLFGLEDPRQILFAIGGLVAILWMFQYLILI